MAGEKQLSAQDIMNINNYFLLNALERTYTMQRTDFKSAQEMKEIEIDPAPGWARYIDLNFEMNVDIAVGANGTLPQLSQFAPYNIIQNLQLSLGGGAFQNINMYFLNLRNSITRYGKMWNQSATNYPYTAQLLYNIPDPQAGINKWKFTIRIPLQVQPGSAAGLIPLGNSAVKLTLRLTTANALHGMDHFLSPLVGGSNVTVQIAPTAASFVQPVITYLTAPMNRADIPQPIIGSLLNVQERNTSFIGAGVKTPIKFTDPFRYLRFWFVVTDGTGAPNSEAISALELDLLPAYAKDLFESKTAMASYYQSVRDRYGFDLPPGVFVFDYFTGSDNWDPNGTQTIDGTIFTTLQAQLTLDAGVPSASPARITSFAECMSSINF